MSKYKIDILKIRHTLHGNVEYFNEILIISVKEQGASDG